MNITIPVPPSWETALCFGMGLFFGRAFGKSLDQDIQGTDWFNQQSKLRQWIIKRLLDFLHHWWIGALLMILAPQITWNPTLAQGLYWFGAGLFIDDLPDIPPRLREIFEGYVDWWKAKPETGGPDH